MAHTTDDYKSGNVYVELAKWDDDSSPPTLPTDYVHMGNVTQLSEEPKITKKSHTAHYDGVQTLDKKVTTKRECTLKFTSDEITDENLRMFYSGEIVGNTIVPLSSVGETFTVRVTEFLLSGEEKQTVWHKVEVSPSAALEKVVDGDGETDWIKLEFTGEILDDSVNNPTNPWGLISVAPTT